MRSPKYALLCLAALAGCERSPTRAQVDFHRPLPAGQSTGTWVARFNGDSLSDAELNRRFAEMSPYARARYQTVEQRRDYVEGIVRFELLTQEAVRQGLANDPEVIEGARRALVQALLKKELEEKIDSITDAQVQAYYQLHLADYVKPAMTRLADIVFERGHRAQAEVVLAKVKELPPLDYAAFGKLAREHSEDEKSKALEGDLRFLSDEELGKQFGPQLASAAAALQKVGDVTTELVDDGARLHILKLQGRQIALNLPVDQAKPSIQRVLLNESRQDRVRALLERLKKQANVELNESALAALVIDVKAPAAEAKGPAADYLPAPQGPAPTR